MDTLSRFLKHVKLVPSGCLEWTGCKLKTGYPMFKDGKMVYAHRWAYTQVHGPIPKDHQIDHLCRNRSCVNWQHLEAVTQKENLRRISWLPMLHRAVARLASEGWTIEELKREIG